MRAPTNHVRVYVRVVDPSTSGCAWILRVSVWYLVLLGCCTMLSGESSFARTVCTLGLVLFHVCAG